MKNLDDYTWEKQILLFNRINTYSESISQATLMSFKSCLSHIDNNSDDYSRCSTIKGAFYLAEYFIKKLINIEISFEDILPDSNPEEIKNYIKSVSGAISILFLRIEESIEEYLIRNPEDFEQISKLFANFFDTIDPQLSEREKISYTFTHSKDYNYHCIFDRWKESIQSNGLEALNWYKKYYKNCNKIYNFHFNAFVEMISKGGHSDEEIENLIFSYNNFSVPYNREKILDENLSIKSERIDFLNEGVRSLFIENMNKVIKDGIKLKEIDFEPIWECFLKETRGIIKE